MAYLLSGSRIDGSRDMRAQPHTMHTYNIRLFILTFADVLCEQDNGGPRMGHFGQIPPTPHLVEEPAMLLIKIANKFYVRDQFINS